MRRVAADDGRKVVVERVGEEGVGVGFGGGVIAVRGRVKTLMLAEVIICLPKQLKMINGVESCPPRIHHRATTRGRAICDDGNRDQISGGKSVCNDKPAVRAGVAADERRRDGHGWVSAVI